MTASNISSEPGSVLARLDARPTPQHPMEGFLPVSLPAVQGNPLSASAARVLSSPTPEVLRSRASARQPQLLIPGTASLTPQRQLKQHSCHSQNKVPSCRRKDGSKILAHHQQMIPFILSRQLPRKNGHFQLTQQNLEATGCIYIPWNNTQSCYSVTPGPCFVPSRSECKPETCFVYRRHLQNQNRQRQKKKHLLN